MITLGHPTTMTTPVRLTAEYGRLLGVATLAGAVLVGIGWVPTSRMAGPDGLLAMGVGIGISYFAAMVAGLAIVFFRARTPGERQVMAMGAMAARMALTLGLFLGAALLKVAALRPMALWMAVSYLVFLVVETVFFVRLVRGREAGSN